MKLSHREQQMLKIIRGHTFLLATVRAAYLEMGSTDDDPICGMILAALQGAQTWLGASEIERIMKVTADVVQETRNEH